MKIGRNAQKHSKNKVNKYLFITILLIVSITIVLYRMYGKEEIYLVKDGVIEDTTTCNAFVIKNENIIDVDNSKGLVPTVSEGSRVSKNNIIATYRESEYNDNQQKLQDLDAKILNAMKDINIEYSVDIVNLETQVINLVINSQKTTSMIDMQENKTAINNLLSKRADIIGQLSPEDAYVKQLIADRKNLQTQIKASSSNVRANVGGIVSYTTDGLEDKLTEKTIKTLNYDDVKNYIDKKEQNKTNKIRITSNYEAYLLVRVNNVEKEYLKENNSYSLRIIGAELSELNAKISKITETEQGYEILFRVTNGVEHLVDIRECEVEIVWTSYEGLIVPNDAIEEKEDQKKYVKIINRGDYVNVPIKIERENNTYSIVSNYERNNVNDCILERYDQIVLEKD